MSAFLLIALFAPAFPTQGEIDDLEKRWVARYDALRNTPCPAPLDRRSTPGSHAVTGSAAVAAWVTEPKTQQCLRAADTLMGTEDVDTPESKRVIAACAPQIRRLAELDQQTVGCTLGMTAIPDVMSLLQVARAVTLVARAESAAGRSDLAAWTLLRLMRAARMAEGDGTLLAGAVSAAIQSLAIEAAHPLELGADRGRLVAALASLRARTFHPHRAIQGEGVHMAINAVLPTVMPADWSPPGGWPMARPAASAAGVGSGLGLPSFPATARQEAAVIWWAIDQITSREEAACPARSTVRACLAGLAASAPPEDVEPPGKMQQIAAIAQMVAGDGAPFRALILDLISQIVVPAWTPLWERQLEAQVMAQALALRWAAQANGGRCVQDIPGIGVVTTKAPGRVVEAPEWVGRAVRVEVPCR